MIERTSPPGSHARLPGGTPMLSRLVALLIASCLVASPASAQVEQLLKGITGSGVADSKTSAGLKEALQVATEKAVGLTGRPNGYFGDAAIKILMPEKLQTMQQGLRAVGYGPQIDEFVLSMNRAAEHAAPAAKQIFSDAISQMSFEDAKKILTGGNTAATDYFKAKTSDKLTAAFKPIVSKSMNDVGVTRQYQALVGKFETIPFAKTQSLDLNNYVTSKALDGLFHVVGEEEAQIRTNPAARTAALVQEASPRQWPPAGARGQNDRDRVAGRAGDALEPKRRHGEQELPALPVRGRLCQVLQIHVVDEPQAHGDQRDHVEDVAEGR